MTAWMELQNFVNGYGFGISVKELAAKAYYNMQSKGHNVCIVNEKYLEVDEITYQFIKSKKYNGWIVKAIERA